MFVTDDLSEMALLTAIHRKGQHVWSSVSAMSFRPWFHAVAEFRDRKERYRQTTFLARIDHLMELHRYARITQLDLVSPGHMNGTGRWAMSPLQEILEGEDPDTEGQKAHVYLTENGDRYVDSLIGSKESELLNVRSIIKSSEFAAESRGRRKPPKAGQGRSGRRT